jgi:hypothetical protein
MDAAPANSRQTARSSWLFGCAAIAAAALLVGVTVAFHGPMMFRPLGVRVQMGDAMRPFALAAIADVALFALAFRRRAWRRAASVLAVAIVAVSILTTARGAAPVYPVSDNALIELATINALEGRQLYGPYSRYGWQHPGPLLFYLLAPFYAAAGSRTAGLAAGALAINLAALAVALWVLIRHAGPALTVSFTALFALYVARVPGLVVSSWNAHATIFASAAVLVISAVVAAGQIRLLPLFFAVASFVLQTHVATFPLVAVTAALVAAAIGRRWIGASTEERAVLKTQANRAGWVLAALWLLPLVEELSRPGGNMSAMWQFARQPPHGGTLPQAFDAWAGALTGVFRAALPLPRGRLIGHTMVAWPRLFAVLHLVLLAAVVVWAARHRRRVHAWMAAQSLAASLAALWAVTRIPDGIHDHEVFWISAVGVVGAASIAAAVVDSVVSERSPLIRSRGPLVAGLAAALLLIGVSLGGLRQITVAGGPSRSKASDDHVMRVTGAIQSEIERRGSRRPMVVIDQRVWDWAAGVILQLRRQGIRIVIDDGLVAMFAGTLAPDGSEDLEISFCSGPCHARLISRPGNIVVLLTDSIAIDARPLRR